MADPVRLALSVVLAAALAFFSASGHGALANRLHNSASPYLAAHATDPVAWQPMDAEVWQTARHLTRPLFIAVGYLSCHGCHTMHRESYRDPRIARLLNRHFVPVLVDRELEPAVDRRLLDFVNDTRGYAGWPLHVIVTANGHPVSGFAYQEKAVLEAYLQTFVARWEQEGPAIEGLAAKADAAYWADRLEQERSLHSASLQDLLMAFLEQAAGAADDRRGGFGSGSKFPSVPQLAALLELHHILPDGALGDFLRRSFDAMIDGALRDHVAGGFFRYVEDPDWRTPHYEKMLHTNVQLARLLYQASAAFAEPSYRRVALDTLDFVERAMAHPAGGFVAAIAAVDEHGREGGVYLWDSEELEALLDTEGQARIRNGLSEAADARQVLPLLGRDAAPLAAKLREVRSERRALRDDKRLLAWNALALAAFAEAYADLQDGQRASAASLAQRLLALAREPERLPRSFDDERPAGLADYAYLAEALLAWSQASGDMTALAPLPGLLEVACARFHTPSGWLAEDPTPLTWGVPSRALQDQELPSPSAVWLRSAMLLGEETGNKDLVRTARQLAMDWPVSLRDNAFFHATHIVALVQAHTTGRRRSTDPRDAANGG